MRLCLCRSAVSRWLLFFFFLLNWCIACVRSCIRKIGALWSRDALAFSVLCDDRSYILALICTWVVGNYRKNSHLTVYSQIWKSHHLLWLFLVLILLYNPTLFCYAHEIFVYKHICICTYCCKPNIYALFKCMHEEIWKILD